MLFVGGGVMVAYLRVLKPAENLNRCDKLLESKSRPKVALFLQNFSLAFVEK